MIADGIALPAMNELSESLKQSASHALRAGPPIWSEKDLAWSRYMISDLIEDLRAPRSTAEFHASASRLYEMLANHYLRSRGMWSAKGKAIVRLLGDGDPIFAEAFTTAFHAALTKSDPSPVIDIAQMALHADGGFLFDGYRADAPAEWRVR